MPTSRLPGRRTGAGPLLALCSLLALCLPATSAGAAAAGKQDTPEPQKQAVTDIRTVGTAMFNWYKSEVRPRRQKELVLESDAKTVDVASVPVISRADLAKLLVPKYLKDVPKNDPWGHPYEFRLNKDPEADSAMAIRSAGSDGTFAGTQYEIAAFPKADSAQDLVWIDGYFARWPGRAEAK